MRKLKTLIDSQRTAIVILIVLNLLQLRYLGLLHIKVKDIEKKMSLISKDKINVDKKNISIK
tara:strand:+ start:65 stop:250 length:186 start_codon:yes stop_codon:yes gene_type:complete